MFFHIWSNYAIPSAGSQWVIKCSLIIWLTQLKSCENHLASEQAEIPHEAISSGAKVNVKQRIYSKLQSKCQQSRKQLNIYTAPSTSHLSEQVKIINSTEYIMYVCIKI